MKQSHKSHTHYLAQHKLNRFYGRNNYFYNPVCFLFNDTADDHGTVHENKHINEEAAYIGDSHIYFRYGLFFVALFGPFKRFYLYIGRNIPEDLFQLRNVVRSQFPVLNLLSYLLCDISLNIRINLSRAVHPDFHRIVLCRFNYAYGMQTAFGKMGLVVFQITLSFEYEFGIVAVLKHLLRYPRRVDHFYTFFVAVLKSRHQCRNGNQGGHKQRRHKRGYKKRFLANADKKFPANDKIYFFQIHILCLLIRYKFNKYVVHPGYDFIHPHNG